MSKSDIAVKAHEVALIAARAEQIPHQVAQAYMQAYRDAVVGMEEDQKEQKAKNLRGTIQMVEINSGQSVDICNISECTVMRITLRGSGAFTTEVRSLFECSNTEQSPSQTRSTTEQSTGE